MDTYLAISLYLVLVVFTTFTYTTASAVGCSPPLQHSPLASYHYGLASNSIADISAVGELKGCVSRGFYSFLGYK